MDVEPVINWGLQIKHGKKMKYKVLDSQNNTFNFNIPRSRSMGRSHSAFAYSFAKFIIERGGAVFYICSIWARLSAERMAKHKGGAAAMATAALKMEAGTFKGRIPSATMG